jgi:hypothetical protein
LDPWTLEIPYGGKANRLVRAGSSGARSVLMVLDHIAEQGDVDESERDHQARESCRDHPFGALYWSRLTCATKHAEG